MASSKALRDDILNVLDYLSDAELVLFANSVSMTPTRVTWHSYDPAAQFIVSRDHPTIDQYLQWVSSGAYSAVMLDGSLLQFTYSLDDKRITGHRLAYVPCPFDVDRELLAGGDSLVDIMDLYRGTDAVLRSPLRIDFDPASAKPEHPTTHLTINSADCRIPCVAPVHVLRFVDMVFRNFYAPYWRAHRPFFRTAAWRHLDVEPARDLDRTVPHILWDIRATAQDLAAQDVG